MSRFFLRHKFIGILIVSAFSLFLGHSLVRAATAPVPVNTLPNANDFTQGNRVSLITAIYDGSNYFLNAPDSTVRLYSPNKTGNTITIINGGNCPGQGGDEGPTNSEATTVFRIYSLTPILGNPNYNNTPFGTRSKLLKQVTSDTIGCLTTYNISFDSQEAAVDSGPAEGKYAFEISATQSGQAGWNMFRYQVVAGGGRLSYYAGSGDHFALKAAGDPTPFPGDTGEFRMGFAPGCALKENQPPSGSVRLSFFDPDAGEGNQKGESPVRTTLIEYDANNNPTGKSWDLNTTQGNNVSGFFDIADKISGHHKYEWVWHHIYDANGIQFQLPYDSYNTLINFNSDDCPPDTPADDASCTATVQAGAPFDPGQSVRITIVASNDGRSTWQPSSYLLKRVGPSVKNIGNVPNPVAPGGSATFTDTVTAPGAGNTTILTYRMYKDSGGTPFGTSCTAKVPTKGKTGPFTIDCKNTHVAPISSGATYYTVEQDAGTGVTVPNPFPPPATIFIPPSYHHVEHPATEVPIHIHFAGDDGSSNDYFETIPGNPSQARDYDTFNKFSFLWPHVTYTVTLEADNQGSESLGENQNGPYTYSFVAQDTLPGDCLHGSGSGEICTPGGVIDLEPGERGTFSYAVHLTNETNKAFSVQDQANGYSFHVNTTGGVVYDGNQIAPAATSPNEILPGDHNIVVSIPLIVNWRGTYGVEFRYRNTAQAIGTAPDREVPCPAPTPATAKVRPYFKSFGGDISAGGSFALSNGQCGNPPNYGSILAYAVSKRATYNGNGSPGPKGASVDFGAYALGLIQGNENGYLGFYDYGIGNSGDNNEYKRLSFANVGGGLGTPLGGGYMAGDNSGGQQPAVGPSHCVLDYFDNTPKTQTPQFTPASSIPASIFSGTQADANGIVGQHFYQPTGGSSYVTLPGGTITGKVSIFVSGDLYISGNLNYKDWNPTDTQDAPYLSVIVQGNIIVDHNVSRLNGFFVTQSPGIFATCNSQSGEGNMAQADDLSEWCRGTQLIVNGAVYAQQVKLLRSLGSLDSAPGNNSERPENSNTGNTAEIFNFSPSVLLANPNLQATTGGAVTPGLLQGVFSLPPVF